MRDGNACVNTSVSSVTPNICNKESEFPSVTSSAAPNKLSISMPSK
ncbi:MAG: hypothetical protein IPL12_11590 [Bacteroidetes bacterium]|nr:hypothetical protein [Bacteroidota bacterium]